MQTQVESNTTVEVPLMACLYRIPTNLQQFVVALCSIVTGYIIGSSFHWIQINKMPKFYFSPFGNYNYISKISNLSQQFGPYNNPKIHVESNPRGAERLPPGIVEPHSDFHLHKIAGNFSEESEAKPKYLLALTVGYDQRDIINSIVKKFTDKFAVVLFHYDGRASEWDQFEWSQRAIHIIARKQTKWWFAKRFLHPNIVASYEYIFLWDEDLGTENFNAEEYIRLAQKHGLEISQPAIESKEHVIWSITKRRRGVEAHKQAREKDAQCHNRRFPPCSGFVEIMAPVFSRKSWPCVWQMIQNDLVHGWGLDLNLWRCVKEPQDDIGIIDAQWVEHKKLPSLGDQGAYINGKPPWEGVRARCFEEWQEFNRRMNKVEGKSEYLSPRSRWRLRWQWYRKSTAKSLMKSGTRGVRRNASTNFRRKKIDQLSNRIPSTLKFCKN